MSLELIERDERFAKSSGKTYTLVEVVRGPAAMVEKGPDDTVFAFPVVMILELILALAMGVALVGFSLVKDAPLEDLANPLKTTDPAKAPWYFMGLQEMLEHMHPTLAGVALPGMAVVFLLAIPYIDVDRFGAGKWFTSTRGKLITLLTSIYATVSMTAFILLDHAYPPREVLRGILPPALTQGIIPALSLAVVTVVPVFVLKWISKPRPTKREIVMVLFTMLFISGVVLTLTGFFCRGPGFELYLPWKMPPGYHPLDHL